MFSLSYQLFFFLYCDCNTFDDKGMRENNLHNLRVTASSWLKFIVYIYSLLNLFQVGDLLNFLSAVFFGVHMLRTEHISRSTKRENFLPLLGYEVSLLFHFHVYNGNKKRGLLSLIAWFDQL